MDIDFYNIICRRYFSAIKNTDQTLEQYYRMTVEIMSSINMVKLLPHFSIWPSYFDVVTLSVGCMHMDYNLLETFGSGKMEAK